MERQTPIDIDPLFGAQTIPIKGSLHFTHHLPDASYVLRQGEVGSLGIVHFSELSLHAARHRSRIRKAFELHLEHPGTVGIDVNDRSLRDFSLHTEVPTVPAFAHGNAVEAGEGNSRRPRVAQLDPLVRIRVARVRELTELGTSGDVSYRSRYYLLDHDWLLRDRCGFRHRFVVRRTVEEQRSDSEAKNCFEPGKSAGRRWDADEAIAKPEPRDADH